MRVPRIKLWSWTDRRYPIAFFGGLSAVLLLVCCLVGVVGLYQSNNDRGGQIYSLTADSQCRSGIATKVDVALLDAFHWVIAHPAAGSPQEAQERSTLLRDIEEARSERAHTPTVCNSTGTVPTEQPAIPPPPQSPTTSTPQESP